jgi:hypothetical protein
LNAVWPASRSAATVSPGRSGLIPLAYTGTSAAASARAGAPRSASRWRQSGTPARRAARIVQGDVDGRDRLRDRTGLARLDRQHGGARRQRGKGSVRRRERTADDERREHRLDQARAVLGAARRKVAPRLAPAERAVDVLDANQHRGAVVHDAERRPHRHPDRPAQHVHLDAGDRRRRRAVAIPGGDGHSAAL